IVSSLVLFAMQVNIERMPYGLFRRLTEDWKLLLAFAMAFLAAIGIAVLSVFTEKSSLAWVVLFGAWGIVFILVLFLYAYKRALFLISPSRQLGIVLQGARNELRAWAKRAERARPLFENEAPKPYPSPLDPTHDLARLA